MPNSASADTSALGALLIRSTNDVRSAPVRAGGGPGGPTSTKRVRALASSTTPSASADNPRWVAANGEVTAASTWPQGDFRNIYFQPDNLRQTLERVDALRSHVPSGMTLPAATDGGGDADGAVSGSRAVLSAGAGGGADLAGAEASDRRALAGAAFGLGFIVGPALGGLLRQQVLTRQFDSGLALGHLLKGIETASGIAQACGVEAPLLAACRNNWAAAETRLIPAPTNRR